MHQNWAVRITRPPQGYPTPDDFEIVEEPLGTPADGEVLFRAHYLSIAPAVRRNLPAPPDDPQPLGGISKIGDVVVSGPRPPTSGTAGPCVGEVLESRHPDFAVGDLVRGGSTWQTLHVVPGGSLTKLPAGADLKHELGVLGQQGFVAWWGMRRIGRPKPGETVVVSAAGGAIGMLAGQLAALDGARVIGVASGDKVNYTTDVLGFAGCIDRTAGDVGPELDRWCPRGIDVYFDNVGGTVARAAFDRLRNFGRYVVCGMAGEYNERESDAGPPLRPVLRKRLRIEGYVIYDHYDEYPQFRAEVEPLVADGNIRYRYDITPGLASAPAALTRLLRGQNAGKVLIDLRD